MMGRRITSLTSRPPVTSIHNTKIIITIVVSICAGIQAHVFSAKCMGPSTAAVNVVTYSISTHQQLLTVVVMMHAFLTA